KMLSTQADALAFAFASRPRETAMSFGPEDRPGSRAAELMRWAAQDQEASAALGINSWEGKVYFNAERFEAMLELWPAFALIEEAISRHDGPSDALAPYGASEFLDKILATRDAAAAALPGSEYLVDKLIAALEAPGRS
ncbi:MAG TPA: hypothetical protein VIO60_10235, partial [Rectinemataceae bacterium]